MAFRIIVLQAFTGLRAQLDVFTIITMRKARVVGLLFVATATLAQQPQSVEITSEPSHHLVFQNEYVRVFDVTVAPKASTLIHRHNYDYVFVTLGDSDVVSVRPGEKPISLLLKDGEVRFTPGSFAHAAINNADRPFHNITIELLKPSSNVKTCTDTCNDPSYVCGGICPEKVKRISSDQWMMSLITLPPTAGLKKHTHTMPHLVIAVSALDLTSQSDAGSNNIHQGPGGLSWVPAGNTHTLTNNSTKPAQFVTLEFKPEQPKQ